GGRRPASEDSADRAGPLLRHRIYAEGRGQWRRPGFGRRSICRGRHRTLPENRREWRQADPRRDEDPHPLQRRGPGGGRLRDRDGSDAGREGAGSALLRLRRRDASPVARRPAHLVGTAAGRDRPFHHHGWGGGGLPRPRRSGPGLARRGSNRGERGHGEQDRDVRLGRDRPGERRPVLRRGADEHDRFRSAFRRENPDRGALPSRGPPPRRAADRPEGESGPEPGLRRDAREVHHGLHHRDRSVEARPAAFDEEGPIASKEGDLEEREGPEGSLSAYAFTDRASSRRRAARHDMVRLLPPGRRDGRPPATLPEGREGHRGATEPRGGLEGPARGEGSDEPRRRGLRPRAAAGTGRRKPDQGAAAPPRSGAVRVRTVPPPRGDGPPREGTDAG